MGAVTTIKLVAVLVEVIYFLDTAADVPADLEFEGLERVPSGWSSLTRTPSAAGGARYPGQRRTRRTHPGLDWPFIQRTLRERKLTDCAVVEVSNG